MIELGQPSLEASLDIAISKAAIPDEEARAMHDVLPRIVSLVLYLVPTLRPVVTPEPTR